VAGDADAVTGSDSTGRHLIGTGITKDGELLGNQSLLWTDGKRVAPGPPGDFAAVAVNRSTAQSSR
jgi:hypothetical protein